MIALWLVTGFLGSGKTTLLREVLVSSGRETGVIVNEVGAIGIDQLLLEEVVPGTVLLPNGCLCCTASAGLVESLENLIGLSEVDGAQPLQRIIIETTGLADPRPVVASLIQFSQQRDLTVFNGVITVVDCVNADAQRVAQPEWVPQIMAADALLLSKTDQVNSEEAAALASLLQTLNPLARVFDKSMPQLASKLFQTHASFADPRSSPGASLVYRGEAPHAKVKTYAVSVEEPIDWMRFSIWLMLALRRHGDKLLRVKAVIWQLEDEAPVLLQAVQHLVYPPVHLEKLRGSKKVSSIVLISRGIESEHVLQSLYSFLGITHRG